MCIISSPKLPGLRVPVFQLWRLRFALHGYFMGKLVSAYIQVPPLNSKKKHKSKILSNLANLQLYK